MKTHSVLSRKFFLPFATLTAIFSVSVMHATAHDESGHGHSEHVEAPKGMTVDVKTKPAPGGILVNLKTKKFRFAPHHMAADHTKKVKHVQGEGHAHLYVDGKMQTLLVASWTYVKLDPGKYTVKAGLNNNNHLAYMLNDKLVEDETKVEVKE